MDSTSLSGIHFVGTVNWGQEPGWHLPVGGKQRLTIRGRECTTLGVASGDESMNEVMMNVEVKMKLKTEGHFDKKGQFKD